MKRAVSLLLLGSLMFANANIEKVHAHAEAYYCEYGGGHENSDHKEHDCSTYNAIEALTYTAYVIFTVVGVVALVALVASVANRQRQLQGN